MRKFFILPLFSLLLSPLLVTNSLSAADDGVFFNTPKAGIVKIIEPVEQPAVKENTKQNVVKTPVNAKTTPVTRVVAPTTTNTITITGKTLSITDVSNTTTDAKNHVNKYGDKFLYGHNTSGVFGNLKQLSEGDTFSVTYNNVLTSYKIEKIVIFEKNAENGKLQLDGSGNYMLSVSKAKFGIKAYDLSIMTCHGTSYGNGDASHRLVIFANRI